MTWLLGIAALVGIVIWYRAFRVERTPHRRAGSPTLYRAAPNQDPTGDLDLSDLWKRRAKREYDK